MDSIANFLYERARQLYVTEPNRYNFSLHIDVHFVRTSVQFAKLSLKNARTKTSELTVVTPCHELQEEEPQRAHPMSLTWGYHI